MKKNIRCGLIGFGTVGSGVYELLKKNSKLIKDRTDIDISIKMICDLRAQEISGKVDGAAVTDDWNKILADEEIDTVIELIGGTRPAKNIIMDSLKKGKNVVTANKKLLAEDGKDIFELECRAQGKLGFEAAVGGGIPCILSLKNGLAGNKIKSVEGILNGTTNYILTQMDDHGLSFEEALKDAQNMGFAEADPTFDIEGYDAGHKIAILSMLAYNQEIDYGSIYIEGIKNINQIDINYAREMGYVIKLLGISKHADDEIDIRVHPVMLDLDHPLASIRNEYNAVMYDGDMTGPVVLYGKGAGSLPTASAVISDVIQMAQLEDVHTRCIKVSSCAKYMQHEKRALKYYIRVQVEDKPGILAKIAGTFGENGISIKSVIQKPLLERYTEHDILPIFNENGKDKNATLVIMTHKSFEDNMFKAVEEIKKFSFVEGDMTLIRVEDFSDF